MVTGHTYFTSNYYQKVKQGYVTTVKEIQEFIAYVSEESNPGNISTVDGGEGLFTMESSAKKHDMVGDDERLKGFIRRHRTIMEALDIIEVVDDTERFGYDLHKVLEFEQKIQRAVTEDPEFTDIIENITVPAGRNIKLACSVKNLGPYKVAWMHFEQSAILTVHNHVITRNPRISVTHDKHDKHRTWYLHINNVQEEDRGRYMCQINTVTAKTQFAYVHVVVPPNIDDTLTSSDVIVREGSNVTLRCRATGSPTPSIKWKRDDGSKISIRKDVTEVTEWEGEALELYRISRTGMGAYLCIASNGVPPSVSKRIKVSVDFAPMVWIPHQLVGVPMNYNITLECFIEAHPTSLNYWTRENDQMISESTKYKTETIPGTISYKATMRLTITNVEKSDYGSYKCVAKNPRGETDGTIKLYTSSPPTTPAPPTTETTPRRDTTTTRIIINTPPYGQSATNSVVLLEKGAKYQSNLNEIDKSEQKSSSEGSKGYDWSPQNEHSSAAQILHFSSSYIATLASTFITIIITTPFFIQRIVAQT